MQRSKKAGTKIMVEPDEPLRVYADAGNVYIQMMSVVGLCSSGLNCRYAYDRQSLVKVVVVWTEQGERIGCCEIFEH